jgi:thioredoxin reductase
MTVINKDVIIIGAGPAGISTAIQLSRYNIDFLLFEGKSVGGLIRNAFRIENYLGVPAGISGSEMVDRFKKQIENNRISIIHEAIVRLEYEDGKLVAFTQTDTTFRAKIVVMATGTMPKKLALFSGDPIRDNVFYEVVEMAFIMDRQIGIIGAGDAAFDYALSLAARGNFVKIFNRKKKEKCLSVLFKMINGHPNIDYLTERNAADAKLVNDQIQIIFEHQHQTEKYLFDYALVAIGREPAVSLLHGIQQCMESLLESGKLFLVGDVKNQIYRQISIASGDGVKAAMRINNLLKKREL